VGKPENPHHLDRLLVPLDGSEASFHALGSACEIAKLHRASVTTLYVIEVPRTLPVDADLQREFDRGEEILSRADEIARAHKVKLEGSMCQARQAGHAIVDEAIEDDVDAILVGVDYERPYGRFRLGRLPQYVLAHAPCEVWLFRYTPNDVAEA
jgi:nucleotide-binding universal stress UspA family protein